MAMRSRRINNFLELLFLVASGVVGIWVSSTSFQKSKRGWPQQPLKEKVLKSNMRFRDSTPLWPHRPQQPHRPHWPPQPYFIKKLPNSDGLIIPGIEMTNTGPLLWKESSNIQYFTDIWYLSVGGCLGHPMLLFWKLVDKTQRKLLILLPLRAI